MPANASLSAAILEVICASKNSSEEVYDRNHKVPKAVVREPLATAHVSAAHVASGSSAPLEEIAPSTRSSVEHAPPQSHSLSTFAPQREWLRLGERSHSC